MYRSIIGSLLTRSGRRERETPRLMPQALTTFSDHHLRDIGFYRERTVAPRRHLMWM